MVNKPEYANFDAPHKFEAIRSIIAKHLREHPKATCSYSGGSDSDILIDNIEAVRKIFNLPPIRYLYFDTGLEMAATRNHVKETMEKYGVEIEFIKPKKNIVKATREFGVPIFSKFFSQSFEQWQRHDCSPPLSIRDEFLNAEDKVAKRAELSERYPRMNRVINFFCDCDTKGEIITNHQLHICGQPYLKEFMEINPPHFAISDKCCKYCKKMPAIEIQKDYEMIITGERMAEGGVRALGHKVEMGCFAETGKGQFRLRPLYYVSDKDKQWYKDTYGIRYSDAYEVYGLKRTGCCGCSISVSAVQNLEKIKPYEPNVVKAAWNIFGDSYRYREEYNKYKEKRKEEEKK